MITLLLSAPTHSGSCSISPYQATDRPCGGNSRRFFSFSDTPMMTMIGASSTAPIRPI